MHILYIFLLLLVNFFFLLFEFSIWVLSFTRISVLVGLKFGDFFLKPQKD